MRNTTAPFQTGSSLHVLLWPCHDSKAVFMWPTGFLMVGSGPSTALCLPFGKHSVQWLSQFCVKSGLGEEEKKGEVGRNLSLSLQVHYLTWKLKTGPEVWVHDSAGKWGLFVDFIGNVTSKLFGMFPLCLKPCSFVPGPDPLSSSAETFTNSCVSFFISSWLSHHLFVSFDHTAWKVYLNDAERNVLRVSLSVQSRLWNNMVWNSNSISKWAHTFLWPVNHVHFQCAILFSFCFLLSIQTSSSEDLV